MGVTNMYQNPGKEIKRNAVIWTVLLSIPIVIAGLAVVVWLGFIDERLVFLGILVAAGIIVIGIWLVRILGSMIYGFGIMVDCMEHLRDDFFSDEVTFNEEDEEEGEPYSVDIMTVPVEKDGTWTCPFCGYKNPRRVRNCQGKDCGVCVELQQ